MANKDLFALEVVLEVALVFEFEFELEIGLDWIVCELDKTKLSSKNCQKTGGKKFTQEARMGRDKKMDSPKTTDGASLL